MKRRILVVGNWKMHTGLSEALALAAAIGSASFSDVDVVICPPFPWLSPIREAMGRDDVSLGAQNCWTGQSGAYTGEVSASMLRECCTYVIVGHSERRRLFSESDELVRRKVDAVLEAGLSPIICVGEDLATRRGGDAETWVAAQARSALEGRDPSAISRCVVAYEPVWAIGSGEPAGPDDAQEMAHAIRQVAASLQVPAGAALRVLYGGSVSATNCRGFISRPDVDGVLVGGASLDAAAFLAIVDAAAD